MQHLTVCVIMMMHLFCHFVCNSVGGAENAGVENAGVEKAGAITYGKPSEQKTLKIPGV